MRNEKAVSAGTFTGRQWPVELKVWLESARHMLIAAIQAAENELQRIRQIESESSRTKASFPITERFIYIRAGIEECLQILRDQDREWIKRIDSAENLAGTSAGCDTSGEASQGCYIIEFKTWLEGANEMLIPAIQKTEEELQRIRRIESDFSGTEALFPLTEKLTKIRAGMEECLEILRDQNIEWISRVTWIENLEKIPQVWQVPDQLRGSESAVEIEAEVSSKSLISDLGVAPADRRNSVSAAPAQTFPRSRLLPFTILGVAALLITASLSYLIANQSKRISELHQYIYTLKNDLSASKSANRKLALQNNSLNKHITHIEDRSSELKDKNSEMALALQAEHSSLVQSKHDLSMMQAANIKMISEVKSKLMKIASTQTELRASLYLSELSKARSNMPLILSPVWFRPGESAQILNGAFTIRVEQPSGQNSCSGAIVQLSSVPSGLAGKPFNQTFCPQFMVPENFRLKRYMCSLVLLGGKTNDDGTKAYLVAILKK